MDIFWAEILGASGASGASNTLQQNFRGGYRGIGGRDIQHSGGNAPLPPLGDEYDQSEREAIQSEDDLPPDRGWDDIPGFEGMPDLTAAQHGAILKRLMGHRP